MKQARSEERLSRKASDGKMFESSRVKRAYAVVNTSVGESKK